MKKTATRREFVRSAASLGAVVGLGDLSALSGLRPVSDAEARWDPGVVEFDPEIEPLVRLLEETPRERVFEAFAARIEKGTSYKEVLTALHLAGIRNIPPRPDVGWKFHAVLVLHSAHLASLAAADEERWLPIFFALDFFKGQQLYDENESDWSMSAVNETAVSEARDPRKAFVEAMDRWDDEAADAAAAALVRSATPDELFELFAWYGMRDFRNIGHKPIYMANGWRTLEFVGARHAEPMLRSLVYAYLNHHDQPNPSTSELDADGPWRENQGLIDTIGEDWKEGELSSSATLELLSTLRSETWAEASAHVAKLLKDGVAAQSVQDGLFIGAGELLIRQPGIVALHGMTATNGLMYAYAKSTNDRTRRLLLLQNASFLVQFREDMKIYGTVGDGRIDTLEPASLDGDGGEDLEQIFELIGKDGNAAASKALAYLQKGGRRREDFIDAARRSSMIKCKNGHDYKFSSAVAEDQALVSPEWRNHYLAASVHYFRGTGDAENRLVERTHAVLGT